MEDRLPYYSGLNKKNIRNKNDFNRFKHYETDFDHQSGYISRQNT